MGYFMVIAIRGSIGYEKIQSPVLENKEKITKMKTKVICNEV